MTTRPRVQQLHQSGASDGYTLLWDDAAGVWVPALLVDCARPAFGAPGSLAVTTGLSPFPIDGPATILSVQAAVNTAPTGADLIVDVNKNGTTIYTTQANRPKILDGAKVSAVSTDPDVTTLAAGDVLTVDIDQIGSTVAGSDLVVAVRYRMDPL